MYSREKSLATYNTLEVDLAHPQQPSLARQLFALEQSIPFTQALPAVLQHLLTTRLSRHARR